LIVPGAPNDALKKLILTEASPMKPDPTPKVTKSDEEWKKLLTPEQFHVAR
jgi:hypothetical protein